MTRRPPSLALAAARVAKAELSEAASLWHHIAQFGILGKCLLKTTVLIVVEIGSDVSGECGRLKKFHCDNYTRIAYKSKLPNVTNRRANRVRQLIPALDRDDKVFILQ